MSEKRVYFASLKPFGFETKVLLAGRKSIGTGNVQALYQPETTEVITVNVHNYCRNRRLHKERNGLIKEL